MATEKFGQVDVLSRLINQHARPDEDYIIATVSLEDDVGSVAFESFNILPLTFNDVQQGTVKNPVIRTVLTFVQQGWTKPPVLTAEHELKQLYNRRESLTSIQGASFSEKGSSFRSTCEKGA